MATRARSDARSPEAPGEYFEHWIDKFEIVLTGYTKTGYMEEA